MTKAVVDTSAIVGYLVRDDKSLSQAIKENDKLIIPTAVIFETIFVLEKLYGIERQLIFEKLFRVLDIEKFEYERKDVLDTLIAYPDHKKFSVIDLYVAVMAENNDYKLITEDKDLKKWHKS